MNTRVENRKRVITEDVKTLIIETTMSEVVLNLINSAKDVIQDTLDEPGDEFDLIDTMFEVMAQVQKIIKLASKGGCQASTALWDNLQAMLKEGMVTCFIIPDDIRELVESEYDDDPFILVIKNDLGTDTLAFPGKDIMW
jgi:hypothetical protein